MKVIVAGSRGIVNYQLVCMVIDNSGFSISEIISGDAIGVDQLGERYAKENNIKLTIFPANWELYPNSAGMLRNAEMARYGEALIAIWDEVSNGTRNMIKVMRKMDKPVYVYSTKYKSIMEFKHVRKLF